MNDIGCSSFHNDEVVDLIGQATGIAIRHITANRYSQEILANPSAFGFTNITGEMGGTGVPDGYLFWDEVHPTTQTHAVIGELAFDVVVPEPSSIVMLSIAGVALAAGATVRRRRSA